MNMPGKIFTLLLTGLLSLFTAAAQPKQNAKQINVLIVDGFSNHDWQQTTKLVKQILTATGRFNVEVSTTPSTPTAREWKDWNPDFEKYDVVIQNTNNIKDSTMRWPRKVERHLEQYVRDGGGLYILHSANNAFPHWEEYNKMIGLGWRPVTTGVALEIDAKKHIIQIPPGQGEGTSHGDRFDALVHVIHKHPINKGFPEYWKTASMELYLYPRGPAENITVLSAATDSIGGKTWPVDWTVAYEKGRVYNSSMGHLWKGDVYPPGYRCAGFQTTLIRATEWLATGKVTYPLPADFPTANAVSLRPVTTIP